MLVPHKRLSLSFGKATEKNWNQQVSINERRRFRVHGCSEMLISSGLAIVFMSASKWCAGVFQYKALRRWP